MIWRLVLSEKIRDTLVDVEARWTVPDLVIAHQLLDELEKAEKRAQQKAQASNRMRRRR